MYSGCAGKNIVAGIGVGLLLGAGATPAFAQTPASEGQRQRYQIGMMERVLEGAVEHGASVTRDRLQALLPAEMLLSENVRVRGYRLEGYGTFFDVSVPMLEGSLTWSFRTLDQYDLGLQSALNTIRALVDKVGDTDIQQALKRIELQVTPAAPQSSASQSPANPVVPAAVRSEAEAPATPATGSGSSSDRILDDPAEAYRAEVRSALMTAMLDYSRGLDLAENEMLTVAAHGNDPGSRLGPADSQARITMISVRGGDLRLFLAGQITREEARQRMIVNVF
jgi:hypothetical protein